MNRMPLLSVAICTYNRCDLLGGAIESICTQPLDPAAYEVIVVDNASTDATLEVVEEMQARFPACTIRYVLETTPGLSFARNSALAEAAAPYIAYVDDDARVAPGYLPGVLALTTQKPLPDCIGGPICPFYTDPKADWFRDRYEARTWGDARRLLRPGESFSGSNMVWRAATLAAVGGFQTRVSMTATAMLFGDETDSFARAWAAGLAGDAVRFLYDPALVVYHWTPAHKMRVAYWLKRAFAGGQSYARLYDDGSLRAKLDVAARGLGLVVAGGARAIWRVPCHPTWQNWAVEEIALACNGLGRLAALFRVPIAVGR
jgi:glycosyltransferase involved in cell wall biosynthesis